MSPNAHTDTQRRRRRLKSFDVGRMLVLNTHPASATLASAGTSSPAASSAASISRMRFLASLAVFLYAAIFSLRSAVWFSL